MTYTISVDKNMTDKELVRYILYRTEWRQEDLAPHIGVSRAQISNVIRETSHLGKAARMLTEQLLQTIEQEENSVETLTE